MPASRNPLVFAGRALLLAGLAAACGPSGDAPGADHPDALPPDQARAVAEVGEPAANALATGLAGALTRARQERGLVGALDFCSLEALELTQEIQDEHDGRLDLKRTTLRWRNPANAPDPREERILEYLRRREGLSPDSVPSQLTARGPEGTVRYYQVLRTAPMCLNCHGDIPSLSPDVRELIRERYPDDRATGYQEGDVRGVIRVEMPAEVPSAPEGG